MSNASVHDLALVRARAAADLEAAIAALGVAYQAYERATHALEEHAGQDLGRYLEAAIVVHLAQAGFGPFLERRLTGTPARLRELVEKQTGRLRL